MTQRESFEKWLSGCQDPQALTIETSFKAGRIYGRAALIADIVAKLEAKKEHKFESDYDATIQSCIEIAKKAGE